MLAGFTNIYYYSNLGEDSVLVMDLLGSNMEDLIKNNPNKRFSIKSALMAAEQMVRLHLLLK